MVNAKVFKRALDEAGVSIRADRRGAYTVVDRSLARSGFVYTASHDRVVLKWRVDPRSRGYLLVRDGRQVGRVGKGVHRFVDTRVSGGGAYDYSVVPVVPSGVFDAYRWGARVEVPDGAGLASASKAAGLKAGAYSRKALPSTTTVTYLTFIPQSKIDAPPAGCEYGSGYQFGGDGHGYDWSTSRYRTAVHASVNWSTKVNTSNVSIGTTHVYRKSTGALVAQRTASGGASYSKKMSEGTTSQIDVRLVTHATNPFCSGWTGAIDGAVNVRLVRSGNYAIIGGNHRQMPNTHVYIYSEGRATTIYTRNYQSAYCLLGPVACDLADFYGSGSF